VERILTNFVSLEIEIKTAKLPSDFTIKGNNKFYEIEKNEHCS
jgi:hypothetical protein